MAPEVLQRKPYGHKVDVFSFGMVLWEIVSGKTLDDYYKRKNIEKTAFNLATKLVDENFRPRIPRKLMREIAALIRNCWLTDPEQRPEFREIVERFNREILPKCVISDEEAVKFWIEMVNKENSTVEMDVHWNTIEKALQDYYRNAEWNPRLLKQTLCDEREIVNIERFGKIVELFGPLGQHDIGLITRIAEVSQLGYYYGEMSAMEAQLLTSQGRYILRISTSTRNFVVTAGGLGTVMHFRICRVKKEGGVFVFHFEGSRGDTFSSIPDLLHHLPETWLQLHNENPEKVEKPPGMLVPVNRSIGKEATYLVVNRSRIGTAPLKRTSDQTIKYFEGLAQGQ